MIKELDSMIQTAMQVMQDCYTNDYKDLDVVIANAKVILNAAAAQKAYDESYKELLESN